MRKLTLTTLLLMAVLNMNAVTVRCEPGKLASLLGGSTLTELTLTGQMDARDFKSLTDHRHSLRVLNMQDVQVVDYSSDKPLFGNVTHFHANEVPSLSLANMPQLTSVTLPSQATGIGEGALAACTSLTQVTLPPALKYLGSYAFTGCTSLQTVALPALLTELGEGAFAQCTSLTAITLQADAAPGNNPSPYQYASCHITTIGARAFAGCKNLKSVALGNQVQVIGAAAFAGTQLTQANLSSMAGLSQVSDWAYAQTPVTSAILPSNTSSLGRGAFALASSLHSITLPHQLNSLPELLLAGCDHLTDIDLHQLAIDSIGDYALYRLNQVSQLTIPSSTQYIGTRAMAGMTGLQRITSYAQSVPELGEEVWLGVNQHLVNLLVPDNCVDYYTSAEQWREFHVQSNVKLGDANGDGQVDIADLNAIVNYMLGMVTGTFIFEAADIDGNGIIDIADVNAVIGLMLGTITSGMPNLPPDTGDALVIHSFGIDAGQRHTIGIHLDNSRDYTALECLIHLPEGLELVEGSITCGSRAITHQVASLAVDNEVAIILYAIPNVDLNGDIDDVVLQFTVVANDRLAPLSSLYADQVMLVTARGECFHAPSTTAQVSRTSGVDLVSANNDRVYGANGSLHIVSTQAGNAQLVALNGMTRTLRVEPGDNAYHNIDPGVYVIRLNGVSHKVKL